MQRMLQRDLADDLALLERLLGRNLRHWLGGNAGAVGGQSIGVRLCALSLLFCAGSCSLVGDVDVEKRPIDYLTVNQCNREMTGFDKRLGEMEVQLKNGAASVEVLEKVQLLRQEIPQLQVKCTGSDVATQRLKKLDRDLEVLAQQLEVESHR
jgi:hypothetical protein